MVADDSLLARAYQIVQSVEGLSPVQAEARIREECDGNEELLELCLGLRGFSPPPEINFEGETVGNYIVGPRVGEGGFGRVYTALRRQPQGTVAIKFLPPGRKPEQTLHGAAREVGFLARLDHENVAGFLDFGRTEEGWIYIVMPLVTGRPILEHCNGERATITRRLRIFQQVLWAFEQIHEHCVHQDVKPNNVLVTAEDRVKVLDFGRATFVNSGAREFGAEDMRPSLPYHPKYASPEQLLGQWITPKHDIYQLGVMLFELLTGRLPFEEKASDEEAYRQAIRFDPPPAPSRVATADMAVCSGLRTEQQLRRVLSGDLDAIVLKALETRPNARYRDARAFADDIAAYLSHQPVGARGGGEGYRLAKLFQRHRAVFSLLLALMALMVLGAAASVRLYRNAVAELETRRAEAHLLESTKASLDRSLEAAEKLRVTSAGEEQRAAEEVAELALAAAAARSREIGYFYRDLADEVDPTRLPVEDRNSLGEFGQDKLIEYRRQSLEKALAHFKEAGDTENVLEVERTLRTVGGRPRGAPTERIPDVRGADSAVSLAGIQWAVARIQAASGNSHGVTTACAAVKAALASHGRDARAREMLEGCAALETSRPAMREGGE